MYFSVLLPLMSSQVLKVYQELFFKLIALKHIHTYIYTQICKSNLMRFYLSFLGSFKCEVMLIVFLWLNWHQRCHNSKSNYHVAHIWPLINKLRPLCISHVGDMRGCGIALAGRPTKYFFFNLYRTTSTVWLTWIHLHKHLLLACGLC